MTISENFQILTCEDPLDKIVLVKNGDAFVLFCSSTNDFFVYFVENSDDCRESWQNAKLRHSYKLDSSVVEIIPYEKKVFIVLENGSLWKLESADSLHQDENDIFEVEDSLETVSAWKLEEVCTIPGNASFVAACPSKLGLCILTKINNTLKIFIVKSTILSSFTLCNESSGSGCCCILNISNLSFDFMNLWLPHVERSEEFLLVGLSEGSLYCFPLALPLKSYCIYKSVHSIVNLKWFEDRQSQRFDALIVVLDSGAVVRLTPISEEVSFPFLPFLNSAVTSKNCIISLVEFETRCLLLNDISNESKPFPIGEVTSACSCIDNSKVLIVASNDCRVYLVSLDELNSLNKSIKVKTDICDPLPLASDLKRLISSSLQLKKINKTLKAHDEYLRAKSLVSRSNILTKHFIISLKLVQVLDNRHTMRLKISFDLPGVLLSKDFWKLKITVSTMNDHSCYVRDLISNIFCEENLIQLVTIPISFDFLYNFDWKLVSCVKEKNVELSLPLGKVEMDASNFLLPPSLRELCTAYQHSSQTFWVNNVSKYSLGIILETSPTDIQEFVAGLLSGSKGLWRHLEWKKMLRNQTVCCVLFGIDVEFKITDNQIIVESCNLKACQALRLAFLLKLNKKQSTELLAHNLMGWYQAENIIRLSRDPQGHIADLYNILRNTTY